VAVEGPTAGAAGGGADNLVLRAARHLLDRVPGLRAGAFRLVKRLPVAAGIGGGSSDAAAALRLLARLNDLRLDHPALIASARATGADVPVCLDPRARMMAGAGERLGGPLGLPPLFAVLANPGVPVETPAVFRRLGLQPGESRPGAAHPPVPPGSDPAGLLHALNTGRNDLEAAAVGLAPAIRDALDLLAGEPGCRLARMSGSGATVFGIFDDCRASARAAASLRAARPGWWARATLLR
jgi:4-diphosphocytidyl-2-C-methyl-D-erythritol kinase